MSGAATTNSTGLSRHRRLARCGVWLGLAIVIGGVTLKLADVAVGWACGTESRHLLRLAPHADTPHRSSEYDYVFRTNSLGLRGPDRPVAKPPGTRRIVVVGDSFVAGWGVAEEHLFTSLLEQRLNAAGSVSLRTEVINVGRTGTSTIRELDLYEHIGRRFSPDVVVLAVFLGNDVAEIVEEHDRDEVARWHPDGIARRTAFGSCPNLYLELAMAKQARDAAGESRERTEQDVLDSLRQTAIRRGVDPAAVAKRFQALPTGVRDECLRGRFPMIYIEHACLDPARYRHALDPDSSFIAQAWPRMESHLSRIHAAVRADSAELVLLVIPSAVQVDRNAFDFQRQLGFEMDEAWLTKPVRMEFLMALWNISANVRLLDLTKPARKSATRLYHVRDGHFNAAGHAFAADALAGYLFDPGEP
jgi:lysophospholipase L1-like esterase